MKAKQTGTTTEKKPTIMNPKLRGTLKLSDLRVKLEFTHVTGIQDLEDYAGLCRAREQDCTSYNTLTHSCETGY